MFYDLWISGQLFWSVLAWVELDGLGWPCACVWDGWGLSLPGLSSSMGLAWVCHMGAEGFPAAR